MVIGGELRVSDNHVPMNITVKAQKQDGGYFRNCYKVDFKIASSLLSFK